MTAGRTVFVSYSRKDEEWRRRFVTMLKPAAARRGLEVWSDDRLVAGEQWRPPLTAALERAAAALLLVSEHFLASEFIMREEVPTLLERGVRPVCALVGECLWEEVEELAALQWAHDPNRDGPVREAGDVVRVCKRLLEGLPADRAPAAPARPAEAPPAAVEPLAVHGALAALHGHIPSPPPGYVGRAELAPLRDAVLTTGAVGIAGRPVGLQGEGGIGKTVLAAALARDEAVRRHFPDGIYWVTVGERGDELAAQLELLDLLGVTAADLRTAREGRRALHEALADRQCLIVADDVWSTAAADAFQATGPRGRVVYTTRHEGVLVEAGAAVQRLDVLPAEAARELLAALTGGPPPPAEGDRVLAATGRIALALALVGAAIGRGSRSWAEAADGLECGAATWLDHPYANSFKAMQVAVAALDRDLADAYRALAVFPEDTVMPIGAVERLWGRPPREALDALAASRLIVLERGGIAFHDLQHEFLLLEASDLRLLHADLLRAYGPWSALPPDEPYVWEHLLHHLRGAGDRAGVLAACTDLGYLAVRAFRAGPYAAESDLRLALDLLPDVAALAWLLDLLTQWGHLLAGHATVGDLAATLATRIADRPAEVDDRGLAALLPDPRLEVRWGLTGTPDALLRALDAPDGVAAVAFSPDGARVGCAGVNGTRLWNVASGQPITTHQMALGTMTYVALSPDLRYVAWGTNGGFEFLEPGGHEPAARLGERVSVRVLAFSPAGDRLAAGCGDGLTRVWSVPGGKSLHVLDDDSPQALAFSGDGTRLASVRFAATLRLWDLATEERRELAGELPGTHSALALSPDGRWLAVSDAWGSALLRLDEVEPPRLLHNRGKAASVLTFAPGSDRLAAGTLGGMVDVWDVATAEHVTALPGPAGEARALAFSADGRVLASGGRTTVRLWNASDTRAARDDPGELRAVAISGDGERLASGSADGTLRLWDARRGDVELIEEVEVQAAGFDGDGGWLAATANDAGVTVLSARDTLFVPFPEMVDGMAFSPAGDRLAVWSRDSLVLADLRTRRKPIAVSSATRQAVFSPDGTQLATLEQRSGPQIWDATTGALVAGRDDLTLAIDLSFAPDGHRLALADWNGVHVWEPAAGEIVAHVGEPASGLRAVAFSPDGDRVATAYEHQGVTVWDLPSGAPVARLRVGANITKILWGPHGITLAVDRGLVQLELVSATETSQSLRRAAGS